MHLRRRRGPSIRRAPRPGSRAPRRSPPADVSGSAASRASMRLRGRARSPGRAPRATPAGCRDRSSFANAMVRSIVSRVSPGRPRMNVPCSRMPSRWQSRGELRSARSMRVPLRMLFRISWLPVSKPTRSRRRPLSRSTSSVSYGHVRLRVARPGHAELAEPARDRLGARPVVGEGVVVEEELAHLREERLRVRHLGAARSRRCACGRCARRSSAARGRTCSGSGSRARCRATRRGAGGSRCRSCSTFEVARVDVGHERERGRDP